VGKDGGFKEMSRSKALLIVDVQNDFCPGGTLAVPHGDTVVPVLNNYMMAFQQLGYPVYASRDWHPVETKHFKQFGGLWPIHCLQNSPGAAFHPGLRLPQDAVVISKGMDPDAESYSAFLGFDSQGNAFPAVLQREGVKDIFVGGLATDYCVQASCLDAVGQGYKVYLLKDAIQGVNIKPDDSAKAIHTMVKAGVTFVTLAQLPDFLGESVV
jgi:nicotinamidase/pyrazinamidase